MLTRLTADAAEVVPCFGAVARLTVSETGSPPNVFTTTVFFVSTISVIAFLCTEIFSGLASASSQRLNGRTGMATIWTRSTCATSTQFAPFP